MVAEPAAHVAGSSEGGGSSGSSGAGERGEESSSSAGTGAHDGGSSSATSSAGGSTSGAGSSDGSGGSSGSTGETVVGTPALPAFTDVTIAAGVDYLQGVFHTAPDCLVDQVGPGENGFCTPERTLGGAAVADVDGDGDVDLFVTRTEDTPILFANQGDGSFVDTSAAAGLTESFHGAGAAFGDIDNDGDADLYVASIGDFAYRLYINDGAGHFSEEAALRNADLASELVHSGTTPSFGDYDLDGWLDLYVGEWRTVGGLGDGPSHSRLLHNLGAAEPGVFEDVTVAAGVDVDDVWADVGLLTEGTYSFSPAFVDLDGDRFPELAIASDYRTSRLFWNDGDGSFSDGTLAAGCGVDKNGMGSSFGDFDLDGDLDWYVTSITQELAMGPPENRLYRNAGNRTFSEIADPMGAGRSGWGWGTLWFDPNNDADLDLVAVGGYYFTAHLDEPVRLWSNELVPPLAEVGGMVGFGPNRQRRGVLSFDYDDDGDLDVFVTSNADHPELYRNDNGNGGGWLRVRVIGTSSNRDGLGARVTVWIADDGPPQLREIGVGSHYMGHGERIAHFGLGDGDEPVARVQVYWPASDTTQVFEDVERNTTFVVQEP
ncbi:MAG: CRTAC1 family protein [Nannocystaceae bacterium]